MKRRQKGKAEVRGMRKQGGRKEAGKERRAGGRKGENLVQQVIGTLDCQ